MRLAQGLLALAAATFTLATPLSGASNTAISIDRDPSLLSTGSLVVHIVRTDDLLTDATPSTEVSLLLERLTRVVLRIELDKQDGTLRINDGQVDLEGKVAVARAEALMLPTEATMVEGKMMSVQQMRELAEGLPIGIVKTEIIVQEDASVEPVVVASEEGGDMVVSIKSYDVFVKIIEVEALELAHSTTLFIPILKLQLSLEGDDGKPVSMRAFAFPPTRGDGNVVHKVDERIEGQYLGGKQRQDEGRPHPPPPHHGDGPQGPHRRPHHGEPDHPHPRPHHRHPWHHREGRPGPPAFVRWIAEKLGFAPPPPPPHHRHSGPPPPPHHEIDAVEVDAAKNAPTILESHRRPLPLPLGGLWGPPRRASLMGHFGPHGHQGAHRRPDGSHRRSRFTCKVRHFFRSTAFAIHGLVSSEAFFAALGFLKLVALGAALFVVAKRGSRAFRERREGGVRLEDEEAVAAVSPDVKVNEKVVLETIAEEK